MSKELVEGTDVSELYAATELINVEIEYNDKIWKFKFEPLTWDEKTEMMMDMFTMHKDGTQRVNLVKYMSAVCAKCMREAPKGFDFRRMSPEFGDLLLKAVPGMSNLQVEDIDTEELKN